MGLQIEFDTPGGTYGIEFVWYFESGLRNGRAWYIPYVYLYGDFGYSISTDITSIVSKISNNPSLIFKPSKVTRFDASISVFVVIGYSNFKSPRDYEGSFVGLSVVAWHWKAYTSFGTSCFDIGIGYSTSWFSASYGATYYLLSSTVIQIASKLYDRIKTEIRGIDY